MSRQTIAVSVKASKLTARALAYVVAAVGRKWGVDYAIRRVGEEKYLLLFKARQADAITGCFAEYSRLELKRAKSRQTPIREQLRQAEEQVKKQPQRELTKEAAHGDR